MTRTGSPKTRHCLFLLLSVSLYRDLIQVLVIINFYATCQPDLVSHLLPSLRFYQPTMAGAGLFAVKVPGPCGWPENRKFLIMVQEKQEAFLSLRCFFNILTAIFTQFAILQLASMTFTSTKIDTLEKF